MDGRQSRTGPFHQLQASAGARKCLPKDGQRETLKDDLTPRVVIRDDLRYDEQARTPADLGSRQSTYALPPARVRVLDLDDRVVVDRDSPRHQR